MLKFTITNYTQKPIFVYSDIKMANITNLSQLDLTKQYSYADYLTWQFDEMVELIKGFVYKMSPGASTFHQRIIGKLYLEIGNYLKRKNCKVFFWHLMMSA